MNETRKFSEGLLDEENTPFGPPVEMRSSPEELRQKLSFIPREFIEIGEHFYMQIFVNTIN